MKRKKILKPCWVELPREITGVILQKLGAVQMLKTAQRVCREWRCVCQHPSTWHHIDLHDMHDLGDEWDFMKRDLNRRYRYAVARSQGQLISITIDPYGTEYLLHHISKSCGELKCLRLDGCCRISSEGLIKAVKKFPLLEEMCLCLYHIMDTVGVIEAIGKSCPQLKSFALNRYCFEYSEKPFDTEAQAIAKNMPQLRHLQLWKNNMTNDGLQAILDACRHLESLDMRQCFNICFDGDIDRLCTQRIKDLSLPHHDFNVTLPPYVPY